MSRNLEQLTGFSDWESYFQSVLGSFTDNNCEKLTQITESWYNLLKNGNYPSEITRAKSHITKRVKDVFLYSSSDEHDAIGKAFGFSCPSAAISILLRLKSRNLRSESPFDYLNANGDSLLVSLYNAVVSAFPKFSEEEAVAHLRENLANYVLQFVNEKKFLVNTFPYWRIWAFMKGRISLAIEVINNGEDLAKVIQLCATFDPTSGWGCRLTSVLLVKAYLLNLVRESGKYDDKSIEWFANAQFYIGCDTNPDLQSVYDVLRSTICRMYGMSENSAKVETVNCISNEGISVARNAIKLGFPILQTSIPTPWEIYNNMDGEVSEGDSLKLSGHPTQFDQNANNADSFLRDYRKWVADFLYVFMVNVASLFGNPHPGSANRCALIHVDGYSTKYTDKHGKLCTFTCDLGDDLAKIVKNINNSNIFNVESFREIGSSWNEFIKDRNCPCKAIACRKCTSCKRYKVCDKVNCDQLEICHMYQIRSCYSLGSWP